MSDEVWEGVAPDPELQRALSSAYLGIGVSRLDADQLFHRALLALAQKDREIEAAFRHGFYEGWLTDCPSMNYADLETKAWLYYQKERR